MKAITLWQPWASLLACGAKQFETRSWATKYRGLIAIHAGKEPFHLTLWQGRPEAQKALVEAFGGRIIGDRAINPKGGPFGFDLPYGCIIATAELVGCHIIRRNPYDGVARIYDDTYAAICIEGNEILFGDYTPGRFAWEFANMRMLPEPIPAKGAQGLWNWNGDV